MKLFNQNDQPKINCSNSSSIVPLDGQRTTTLPKKVGKIDSEGPPKNTEFPPECSVVMLPRAVRTWVDDANIQKNQIYTNGN